MISFQNHYKYFPHIVLGAWFTDKDFLNWVEQFGQRNGGGATVAMSLIHMIFLFSLLSLNVGDGEWWSAYTSSGKVTSFKHVNQGGALVEWRVVS